MLSSLSFTCVIRDTSLGASSALNTEGVLGNYMSSCLILHLKICNLLIDQLKSLSKRLFSYILVASILWSARSIMITITLFKVVLVERCIRRCLLDSEAWLNDKTSPDATITSFLAVVLQVLWLTDVSIRSKYTSDEARNLRINSNREHRPNG